MPSRTEVLEAGLEAAGALIKKSKPTAKVGTGGAVGVITTVLVTLGSLVVPDIDMAPVVGVVEQALEGVELGSAPLWTLLGVVVTFGGSWLKKGGPGD